MRANPISALVAALRRLFSRAPSRCPIRARAAIRPGELLAVLAVGSTLALAAPAFGQVYTLDVPSVVLSGSSFDVSVGGIDTAADSLAVYSVGVGGDDPQPLMPAPDGSLRLEDVAAEGLGSVSIELLRNDEVVAESEANVIPGWFSLLPPVLAIAFALMFKQVIPALLVGIWTGAWAARGLDLQGLWMGLLDSFEVFVLAALANPDHAAIILFSLMIGGMVGIVSRNGGMQGVVEHIVRWARTPRDGQLATGFLGLAIFFDDYANTLVVGNTMRSVTDRLHISREKLAYIVDSTAAPVACIALVTTWIGYEVGLVGTAIAGIEGYDESAYSVFLKSILYSFYPILAIFFVFNVAWSPKEFGPMLRAERRARRTGEVLSPGAQVDDAAAGDDRDMMAKSGIPYRSVNAVLPVTTLVVSVLLGLYVTGEGNTLQDIIGSADAYRALMWGSLLGVAVAAGLSLAQRVLTLDETIKSWYAGVKSMMYAMVILVLAWALSEVTAVIHTADYLVSILGETLPPGLVPALVFVIAAATAFSTGTSWGTMGILMPLVVPLAWAILQLNDMADPAHYHIIYSSVSCVLAGAVWGDHCSPISDTTILSSMASGCDHIDHVRTQLPYALLVGVVAVLLGTVPAGFGIPWWVGMVVGGVVLFAGLRIFGEEVLDADERARHIASLGEVGRRRRKR